jgi:hypothetical protein
MKPQQLRISYVGGATCVLEFGGVRLLTDPTFDPAGRDYTRGPVTLAKTERARPAGMKSREPLPMRVLKIEFGCRNAGGDSARFLKNNGIKKIEGATSAGLLALRVLRPLIDP